MTANLANARVWDGTQWVQAVGPAWFESLPQDAVSSGSATVTADVAAHTKGAWTEIISSVAADVSLLYVVVSGINNSGQNTSSLLDIGIGASGSETVIAADINVGAAARTVAALPVFVPSGTRVAARMQSLVTLGKTGLVAIAAHVAGRPSQAPSSVAVLGGNTATSQGVVLTGASGTYVQVTASTSAPYRALGVFAAGASGTMNNAAVTLTVAIGAAGSEVDVGRIIVDAAATESVTNRPAATFVFPATAPAGSRITVKHDLPSSPGNLSVVVIGVP